ncbi:MAG TPA: DUF1328 domain-containing protein [Burkholderiales bacterium]|nr:DUF1328 domain-containing protein [Burkholderiales bacterium]
MLNYAILFFVLALIAGALGYFGLAAIASQIAWILLIIAVVFLIVHMFTGRRPPSTPVV